MDHSIREVIIKLIEKRGRLPADVDLDTFDYVSSGHVDSIGLIKFVVGLESEFNITITAADMENPAFRTVGGVVDLIRMKVEGAA